MLKQYWKHSHIVFTGRVPKHTSECPPPHSPRPPSSSQSSHNSSSSDQEKKKKQPDRCLWLSPSLWGTPGKVEASGNECAAPPDALPRMLTLLSATDYAFCYPPLSWGWWRTERAGGEKGSGRRKEGETVGGGAGAGKGWGVRGKLQPDAGQWGGTSPPPHPSPPPTTPQHTASLLSNCIVSSISASQPPPLHSTNTTTRTTHSPPTCSWRWDISHVVTLLSTPSTFIFLPSLLLSRTHRRSDATRCRCQTNNGI